MASMKYDPTYDFSNRGVDWDEYKREVRLRTDAVWERQKLKDYFRLFYKIFYWDPNSKQYYITMPLHSNFNYPENWKLRVHRGYNPTGKSSAYERELGTLNPSRTVSLAGYESMNDKNTLCYLRFRSYKKCEGNSMYPQIYEDSVEGKPETVNLSCYQEMADMLENCTPYQLNWISDLWHSMEILEDPTSFTGLEPIELTGDEFDNPNVNPMTY
jgi:hypothetical protein